MERLPDEAPQSQGDPNERIISTSKAVALKSQNVTDFLFDQSHKFNVTIEILDRNKGWFYETLWIKIRGRREDVNTILRVIHNALKA